MPVITSKFSVPVILNILNYKSSMILEQIRVESTMSKLSFSEIS
jgi:hypothetical protein